MAKILCVDDDLTIIALKREILQQAGHQVVTCTTVAEAVRQLERESFDAVITDWRLGEESGRSIVAAAKLQSSVPVVVVSGYVAEAFQSAEPTADIYLGKPADPSELVQIISALLRTKAHVFESNAESA